MRHDGTCISVVIPAFNRACALRETLQCLAISDLSGLGKVEIVVVDDGSREPLNQVVESVRVARAMNLRYIHQPNRGVGAARNTGNRATDGEIVLFIDNDILCPPDLIRQHVEAHRQRPGSVVHGPSPFIEPRKRTPFFRYVQTLGYWPTFDPVEEFVPVPIVASGHLSVERWMFEGGVYRDSLTTPGAEEFELSWRLRCRGIPILYAPRITAIHNDSVDLKGMCRRNYKYGIGVAEAVCTYPELRDFPPVQEIIYQNRLSLRRDSARIVAKRSLKRCLSTAPMRAILRSALAPAERVAPMRQLLAPMYKTMLGTAFFRGFRDGLRRFDGSPPQCSLTCEGNATCAK